MCLLFLVFPAFPLNLPSFSLRGSLVLAVSLLICHPLFEINNTSNPSSNQPFKLEIEVEHLIQLMNTVMNQTSSPKPNDLVILVSTSLVSNHNHEVKPVNLVLKTDDKEIKMRWGEIQDRGARESNWTDEENENWKKCLLPKFMHASRSWISFKILGA